MTEPVFDQDPKQPGKAPDPPSRDMGLRSHLQEIAGSARSMSTVFFVLLILILIGGGCALLLR